MTDKGLLDGFHDQVYPDIQKDVFRYTATLSQESKNQRRVCKPYDLFGSGAQKCVPRSLIDLLNLVLAGEGQQKPLHWH